MVIYADYRSVDGVQVPFEVTQFVDGARKLQVQIASVQPE
jgi:hypothetical protein